MDENGLFPILGFSEQDQHPFLRNIIEKRLPEAARENFKKRIDRCVNGDKAGIQVWSKVIVARKKN